MKDRDAEFIDQIFDDKKRDKLLESERGWRYFSIMFGVLCFVFFIWRTFTSDPAHAFPRLGLAFLCFLKSIHSDYNIKLALLAREMKKQSSIEQENHLPKTSRRR